MARADLLVRLFQSNARGDKAAFKKAAEALIAEERDKGHKILSERLLGALSLNGNAHVSAPSFASKQKDLFYEIMPERKIDTLILPALLREQIKKIVEEQHRSDLLHAHNLRARNRILLSGPPGNGKTTIAEAIACELMVPLLVIRYEGLIASFLGETATRLKNAIDYAKTQRCVLFLDEFETIGKERGDTHETGEVKRVVSSLLLQIDSLPDYVLVIAASNHPELLDKAVWRRFQVRAELPLPNLGQLSAFISKKAQDAMLDFGYSSESLAKKIEGLSFAEAEDFCLDIIRGALLAQETKNARAITHCVIEEWGKRFSLKTAPLSEISKARQTAKKTRKV